MAGINGLEWQTVDVKFTQGLDTRTQKKLVVPGKWNVLTNLSTADDDSLRRRNGMAPLVATANGNGLAPYNNEVLVVSGGGVSTVSPSNSSAVAVAGRLGHVGIQKDEVRRSVGMMDTPDVSSGNGSTLYAWRDKSPSNAALGINATLVDETTGAHVFSNTALRTNAGAFGVRCVFVDSAHFVFYIQGTSLYCRVILPNGTIGTEVALITSASLGANSFDVSSFSSNALVTYRWADGTTSVRAMQVVRSGTVPSIITGPTNIFAQAAVPVAAITAVACAPYQSNSFAGIFVTSTGAAAQCGLAAATVSVTTVVTNGPSQLYAGVGATTANCGLTAVDMGLGVDRMRVIRDYRSEWSVNGVNGIDAVDTLPTLTVSSIYLGIVNSNTYSGANPKGVQGPFIHGKAYVYGGRIFVPLLIASVYANASLATSNPRTFNQQNTFFVLDTGANTAQTGPGIVVAKALCGNYGLASINGTAPTVGTPCSSPAISTGRFATAAGELTLLVLTSGGVNVSPTGLVRLVMSPEITYGPIRAQLGESTYTAGGSITSYDGQQLTETGFNYFPEGIRLALGGAGTGAMTAGVHQVCAIYEWIDNAGQRRQSAPSPAVQVTTVATDSILMQVPTLQLSQMLDSAGGSNVQCVAYMTQAGGVIFNRVLLNAGAYAPVLNSTASNSVTLTISDADTAIIGNELLYTQPNAAGTTLANIAPGPATALTQTQNRIWYARADAPGFAYSQEYINNVGLQFNPALGGLLDVNGGPLVTIAGMDEKVIFLCQRKLYAVFGSGPSPTGGFNNYSAPQEIPSDVGCLDARSVLRIPGGLIFKSNKGWYLLGRDLTVRYIGAGVDAFDAFTVTSATMMESQQECRFTLVSASNVMSLVYDYMNDVWSTYKSYTATNNLYVLADAMWSPALNTYVHVSTSDGLNQDTVGVYVDRVGAQAARGIITVARTSWLKMSVMNGFQRVRWLYLTGVAPTSPTSFLTVQVDFDDEYGIVSSSPGPAPGAYQFTVNLSSIAFSGTSIDLRHKLERQKCKTIAFTFTELPTSSTASVMQGIQDITLQLGMKRGVNKLPAAQGVS